MPGALALTTCASTNSDVSNGCCVLAAQIAIVVLAVHEHVRADLQFVEHAEFDASI